MREAAQQMVVAQFRSWKYRRLKEKRQKEMQFLLDETHAMIKVNQNLAKTDKRLKGHVADDDDNIRAELHEMNPTFGCGIEANVPLRIDDQDDETLRHACQTCTHARTTHACTHTCHAEKLCWWRVARVRVRSSTAMWRWATTK